MIQLKNQIHLCDIYEDVIDCFEECKLKFIRFFNEHINMKLLILHTFYIAYHSSTGHPKVYSHSPILTTLMIQKILGISEIKTLTNILKCPNSLKALYEYNKLLIKSQSSRFKSNFLEHIHNFFNHLIDITEPIYQELNSTLSKIVVVDTPDINAYIK